MDVLLGNQPKAGHSLDRLRFGDISGDITARIATTDDLLRDAARLRYDAYHTHGYIDENPTGLFIDDFDMRPSCKTIVVYEKGAPAASARVCLYDPLVSVEGSDWTPALDVFPEEILDLVRRESGDSQPKKALEVMRLVRNAGYERNHEIIFALLRAIGYLILYYDASIIYSGVRKNHIPIYRRLGFSQITEPRAYPKLKFRTALIACIKHQVDNNHPPVNIFEDVSKNDIPYQHLINGQEAIIRKDINDISNTFVPGNNEAVKMLKSWQENKVEKNNSGSVPQTFFDVENNNNLAQGAFQKRRSEPTIEMQ